MKKTIIVAITLLIAFTMSACGSTINQFKLFIVSDNETEINAVLEDFEAVLLSELDRLGTDYTEVVIEVGNETAGLTKLDSNEVQAIILDPNTISNADPSIDRILSSMVFETNYLTEEVTLDDTYTVSVFANDTTEALDFYQYINREDGTPFNVIELMSLDVCLEASQEQGFQTYIESLGNITYTTSLFKSYTVEANESDVMNKLYNKTCDIVVVTPENINEYSSLYSDMLDLSNIVLLQDLDEYYYPGVYTSSLYEGEISNIIAQAFINIKAHSQNDPILEALGHDSYVLFDE